MESAIEVLGGFVQNHGALTILIEVLLLLIIRSFVVNIPKKVSETHADPRKAEIARAKYGEALWFFIYYSTTFIIGITYLWDKEWLWNPRAYWSDNITEPTPFPLGLQILYTTQTAYYIAASIVVLFLTNVRANHKDRFIMLMHHAVTITLLAVSFALGQHRIGSVVLILHDVSDVFLEGAKLCRYSGLDLMTNSVFATFALVFFISRLVIFPTRVLWATFQAYEHNVVYAVSACFAKDGMCEGTPLFVFPLKWFWLTLLGTLQCLHVYWFALIFRMVIRAVAARHIEKDIRSDDEEQLSDDDADHATNNMKNGHKKKND